MIKNVRPVDGSEQLDGEGGTGGEREPIIQGKPCLSILITGPAACVAPLLHVEKRNNSFTEKEHL